MPRIADISDGGQNAWKIFYSRSSILTRMPRAMGTSWITRGSYLPINLFQRQLTYKKIIGGNKFFHRDRHARRAPV